MEYILSLSPIQFQMIMDGLGEILKQKYGGDEDKKQKVLELESQAKAEVLAKKLKTKGKLKLEDLK